MREILLGMALGAVAALLILAAVWLETITPPWRWGKPMKRRLPTPAMEDEEKREVGDAAELERLTRQAGMQNFYLYDGSDQRDPREMAQDYYETRTAPSSHESVRSRRMPENGAASHFFKRYPMRRGK